MLRRATSKSKFQSTLPARGATALHSISVNTPEDFNPRSPHGERLVALPREGSRIYFNPRSPHGERLTEKRLTKIPSIFQSTLPARGATVLAC